MDKPASNVGRSRGRGRGNNAQEALGAQGRGVRRHMQSGPQPSQQNAPSAWGPQGNMAVSRGRASAGPSRSYGDSRPTISTQGAASGAPGQGRASAPPVHARSAQRSGGGDAPPGCREENRGAVRGKRVISDILYTRPTNLATKSGTSGQAIMVEANYFNIIKKPEWSIEQYRVDFSPDVDLMAARKAYLRQHNKLLGGYLFDGTLLFTCTHLKEQMLNKGILELFSKNREGETIQIKIKHVGSIAATNATQVQVLNLILRRAMEGLKLQQLSRNFFDPQAKERINEFKLEIWPGYQTSIRQHEQNILLCVEIAHKVLRTDSVYDILKNCTVNDRDFQTKFKAEVIGMIVITDYNNKTYRVDDVDFNASPLSKFTQKENESTYIQYYKQRYNIQIRDHKQPMLVSRPTERNIRGGVDNLIYLVPELCRATGMTDAMRNNFRLMKAMSEHTRLRPDMRIERLRKFNRRLQECKESIDVLKSWNMQLDTNMVQIPARILPRMKIVFGNRKYNCDERADWTREFRNNAMFSNKALKNWTVIVPQRNVRDIQEFVKMCIRAAAGMKMQMVEPNYIEMPDDRTVSYSKAIDTAASRDPQLIMLTLHSQNGEKYGCIKKKCCIDRPVPSQVVTLRTVAPRNDKGSGLMSVATKVVIQMNAKLMGAPWMIELPLNGLMTVGFDVCHSAYDKNTSFGALVSTMDINRSCKYYSNVTKHMKGQELSTDIGMSMTYALKAYRENHETLPERIMFFRDGVGEGQFHQVIQAEITHLSETLTKIYQSAGVMSGPKFCFIIVSKRINTRYFFKGQNPPPGTVVDDVITLPERYDFFLVSQSVCQGTVSPTNYNVIHDTMGLPADKIQMLAYKMTHLYYNWSGTCRVPAVCQYAHKLAFLVAESINRAPSNALENQLYFL